MNNIDKLLKKVNPFLFKKFELLDKIKDGKKITNYDLEELSNLHRNSLYKTTRNTVMNVCSWLEKENDKDIKILIKKIKKFYERRNNIQ